MEFVSTTESFKVLKLKVGCVGVLVVLAVHVHGIVFSTSYSVRFIYDEDKTIDVLPSACLFLYIRQDERLSLHYHGRLVV